MTDFFSKVKRSINKGTTVISVKSSTMIEVNKIKGEISSLKKEKNDIFKNIGEKAYDMQKEGQIDLSFIVELLSRVFEIDEIIKVKEQAIEDAIKSQEEAIKALDEEVVDVSKELVCECGATLPLNTKFCSKCGKKVEKPEDIIIEEIDNDGIGTEDNIVIDNDDEEIIQDDQDEIVCECGAVLPYETVFCIKCGKKLK